MKYEVGTAGRVWFPLAVAGLMTGLSPCAPAQTIQHGTMGDQTSTTHEVTTQLSPETEWNANPTLPDPEVQFTLADPQQEIFSASMSSQKHKRTKSGDLPETGSRFSDWWYSGFLGLASSFLFNSSGDNALASAIVLATGGSSGGNDPGSNPGGSPGPTGGIPIPIPGSVDPPTTPEPGAFALLGGMTIAGSAVVARRRFKRG